MESDNSGVPPLPIAPISEAEKAKQSEGCEILVSGLKPDTTEMQLAEAFGNFAPVLRVRIMLPQPGLFAKTGIDPEAADVGESLIDAYLKFASREVAEHIAETHGRALVRCLVRGVG